MTYHYLSPSIREDTGKSDLKSFNPQRLIPFLRGLLSDLIFSRTQNPFKVDLFFPVSFDPLHYNRNHHSIMAASIAHSYQVTSQLLEAEHCSWPEHHPATLPLETSHILLWEHLKVPPWQRYTNLRSPDQVTYLPLSCMLMNHQLLPLTLHCRHQQERDILFSFHLGRRSRERLRLLPHADYSNITATATSTRTALGTPSLIRRIPCPRFNPKSKKPTPISQIQTNRSHRSHSIHLFMESNSIKRRYFISPPSQPNFVLVGRLQQTALHYVSNKQHFINPARQAPPPLRPLTILWGGCFTRIVSFLFCKNDRTFYFMEHSIPRISTTTSAIESLLPIPWFHLYITSNYISNDPSPKSISRFKCSRLTSISAMLPLSCSH
jgi:hypothetical protein